MDHRVLLHVQHHQLIHAALEELPQHPDGHGEAEGHDGHEHRGQGQGKLLRPVEHIHQGEADGGAQKAVEGVEHGVPVGDPLIVGVDLPQDFGGVDEAEDGDLQGGGQLDVELHLNPAGDIKEQVGQGAVEGALIAANDNLADNAGVTGFGNRRNGYKSKLPDGSNPQV